MAKINLKSFFKLKLNRKISLKSENRHYIFVFLALLMLVIVGAFIIWTVTFLVSSFAEAFIETSTPPPVEKFDIEGFEKLKLTR
ncbi:MAG: hypothetical protein HY378_00450 [Candidatus Brennerbacteria bacterium]|nr:hypothetical protein [Candidatus Brennerbacteria bacterium]